MATTTDSVTQIHSVNLEKMLVPIRGTSPLIVHRFSEKAKKQMLDSMQGKKTPKEPKDPQRDFEESFYRFTDPLTGEMGYGFPIIAFKAATVGAARLYGKSVTMVNLRQQIFMRGVMGEDGQQLAIIDGKPEMREDVVRVGLNGSDLRYRPMFTEWTTTLEVSYIANAISQESVLSLIEAGGIVSGVGEWRPERKGDFGTYEIDKARSVQVLA